MMKYTLEMEFLAFLMNMVLLFFTAEKRAYQQDRKKCYMGCLLLSQLSIAANVISIYGMGRFSDPWSFFFASAYYLLVMMMMTMMAYFMFSILFEPIPDSRGSKVVNAVLIFLLIAIVTLVALNIWTGCLFTVRDMQYARGPLNAIGYAGVGLEIGMLVFCFFRYKAYMDSTVKKMICTLPFMVGLLVLLQLRDRYMMMNGMISAMTNMLFFLLIHSGQQEWDTLTGLKNRISFLQDISEKLKKKERFQIILIYLKDFSGINRAYGHRGGNAFLCEVAKFMDGFTEEARGYRLGGVEFAMLIPYHSEEYAKECRERVYHRFFRPWDARQNGQILQAAISDLVYQADGKEPEAEELMDEVQYALSMVREKSGTGMAHFDEGFKETMERRGYLINQMQRAISENGFEVYYQPIYNLETNRFSSAEALLRLRDPQTGRMISPGEFIPIAEEVGLVDKIGWIVLEKVCAFLGKHPESGFQTVSVNMSMSQLTDPQFIEKLLYSTERHHIPLGAIRIEITERMITENMKKISEVMQTLTNMGIYFYLDDFGVGYSNFAGVLSLPIDTVKLDYSLVNGAMQSKKQYFILKSLLKTFHEAGFGLVAEGVETEEHANMLMELGADRLQGFYYFRPMPEADVLKTFGNG